MQDHRGPSLAAAIHHQRSDTKTDGAMEGARAAASWSDLPLDMMIAIMDRLHVRDASRMATLNASLNRAFHKSVHSVNVVIPRLSAETLPAVVRAMTKSEWAARSLRVHVYATISMTALAGFLARFSFLERLDIVLHMTNAVLSPDIAPPTVRQLFIRATTSNWWYMAIPNTTTGGACIHPGIRWLHLERCFSSVHTTSLPPHVTHLFLTGCDRFVMHPGCALHALCLHRQPDPSMIDISHCPLLERVIVKDSAVALTYATTGVLHDLVVPEHEKTPLWTWNAAFEEYSEEHMIFPEHVHTILFTNDTHNEIYKRGMNSFVVDSCVMYDISLDDATTMSLRKLAL
jgi:hypothetical protein